MDEILNAKNDNYKVVQKYLTNLYLVNRRKVNLRVYLLIIIKNNKKEFYMSNLGKAGDQYSMPKIRKRTDPQKTQIYRIHYLLLSGNTS